MIENLHKKILITILLGTLVLLILGIYADLGELINVLKKFKWIFIIPVLGFSLLNYAIRFMRWEFYLRKLRIKIPLLRSLIIFMSGFTMSITPGKFGEALKSYLLKISDNIQVSRSAPIVLVERIVDFITFVILALYGSFYFNYGKKIVLSVGFVIAVGILIISRREIFHLILIKVRKIIGDKFADKIQLAYSSIAELIDVKILIPTVMISILSWFFECLGFYIVIRACSFNFSLDLATFVYSFSTIAGAISMLPGGIGLTEGSMTGLLVLNKIEKDAAVAITIIFRLVTLWFAVLLGIISLYFFQKFSGRLKGEEQG